MCNKSTCKSLGASAHPLGPPISSNATPFWEREVVGFLFLLAEPRGACKAEARSKVRGNNPRKGRCDSCQGPHIFLSIQLRITIFNRWLTIFDFRANRQLRTVLWICFRDFKGIWVSRVTSGLVDKVAWHHERVFALVVGPQCQPSAASTCGSRTFCGELATSCERSRVDDGTWEAVSTDEC